MLWKLLIGIAQTILGFLVVLATIVLCCWVVICVRGLVFMGINLFWGLAGFAVVLWGCKEIGKMILK